MGDIYDKNKKFAFSDESNTESPFAKEFIKNVRIFMSRQADFTDEDRATYKAKIESDIAKAKKE